MAEFGTGLASRFAIAVPNAAGCDKTPQYFTKFRFSAMHVLIASSSAFRRDQYLQAIRALGHETSIAESGVDCVCQLRAHSPDLLMLETPLLWGGTEGVLDVLQELNAADPLRIRIVLVAAGAGSIDWFQLSRYRVDDILFRLPTAHELQQAIRHAAPGVAPRPTRPNQQMA